MDINAKVTGNVLVCRLRGELDHHTADEFRDYIDYNLDNNPVRHLVLDMTELSFMDSSGIGVLIGRYKKVTGMGGKTAVVGGNKQILRMFEISGMHEIIRSYASVQQALKEL